MSLTTKQNLAQWLTDLDIEDIYRIASEIDSYDGRFTIGDAGCPPMPTDEMLDLIEQCGMSIHDVIRMLRYGDVPCDDWLGLDGYGNFQSYSDADACECYLLYSDEIIDGILDGYSDYATELLRNADFDEEDEAEEED